MKLGARLGAGLRKLVDLQQLTLSGFIAGLGGYVALFHYGLQRLDFVLLILGGAMFGLTGVALVSTLTASMLIAIRGGESPLGEDGLAPLEGECEYWVRTGYRLPRRRWLPFC